MPARRGCRRLGTEGAEGAGAKEVLGESAPPAPPLAAEGDESYVPDPDGWPNAWGFEVSEILHQTSQLAETDLRPRNFAGALSRYALPHIRQLAGRFRWLGESVADLNQVAALWLVKAVNGYDPQVASTSARTRHRPSSAS